VASFQSAERENMTGFFPLVRWWCHGRWVPRYIVVSFHPAQVVLAIPGSIPIGCNWIRVSREGPPLGTLHRTGTCHASHLPPASRSLVPLSIDLGVSHVPGPRRPVYPQFPLGPRRLVRFTVPPNSLRQTQDIPDQPEEEV